MDARAELVRGYGVNTYTVDGTTQIGWSVVIQAENAQEAERKAQEFWEHNTTYEDVQVHGVYDSNGEPQ